MKKTLLTITIALLTSFSFSALAKDSAALPAIGGYDPVSYHTENKAVRGSGYHAATHKKQTYLFSSKENKALFEAAPAKYVPAFNGWCAYGVAVKKKFHTDPNVFAIVDGKLYLNLDKGIQEKWNAERAALITKAHVNWKKIKRKSASSL